MSNNKKNSHYSPLRQARKEKGLSQKELAELIGTTDVMVSRWENGRHPGPYFLRQLSEFFDKTPAELGLVQTQPLSRSPRIWNVPITRNPFFTGRQALLDLLYERLSTTGKAAPTQPQALYGLGGVGKTQTAAEYVFLYGNEYAHVFWIRAASRDTLIADYVELAHLLELPEKDAQEQQQVIAEVKRWLAENEGWLLILDNADDLLLAQEFLPSQHHGYILFTTRAQATDNIAANIEVEQLTPADGSLLLLRWTRRLGKFARLEQALAADLAAAERIVHEMAGLPLAIIQAASYIEETRCNLDDYLHRYETQRKELLARHSYLLFDYPDSVAATWALSFQQIKEQSPAAAGLLYLCAFLAPDAIPEELLAQGAAELGPNLEFVADDSSQLNKALELLQRYSLIRRELPARTLSIHRLVQVVLKDSLDQATQRLWAERTVRAVNAAFPKTDYGTDNTHHYYLPHVQECATLITQYQLSFPEAAQLLFQAGAFLYYHGFHPQSQALHEQALAIRQQILGPEHPDVAESLNRLAILARNRGDYSQAQEFHQQALIIREKTLGPVHEATAESLNNLSVLYRSLGKYEQAEPLVQRALKVRKKLLGSEHPETLITLLNLANLYADQRKYEQAEQLLQQTLSTAERVLEPEHPLIAHNLSLLAKLSYEQGKSERAEALWKQSLALLEKKFGLEHPTVAERLNGLATIAFAQGHYLKAKSLCEKALAIAEKILGTEHLDTLTYREHLNKIVSQKVAKQDDEDDHPVPPQR
ncbi:MAG TPA: tetratricopeptide repeat protein [Ktedonobacteraceae bacterium]|nr:tetratricopeptide repeat protein [Ktedonobacteraceae bacterium]